MSNTSGNKQRLLIVDDSKVIRVTARKILQDYFETVEAVDGDNAWKILNDEAPFSLIVSDLTMPGLDGFGLLEKIRSSHLPHVSNIPVIIITGANDSEATKQRATEVGATDFIGKPFDAVHLLARTQAHAEAYTTELSLTQETMALEDQALTDPSSGLPNETAFMERGFQQLAYAVRHKSALALFCIDIDNYGDLHTQYGEEAAGTVIKSVAGLLDSCIRQEDMAARTGTARFALLLPGMSNSGIRNLADRLVRDAREQRLESGGTTIRFTVSVGVAAPEITANVRLNALLTSATASLQAAVSQGGNRIVHADGSPGAGSPPRDKPETVLATANPDAVVAAIECVSPQPAGSLPEALTDPLPDLEIVGAEEESATSHAPASNSGLPFSAEDYAQEETIVITAQGGLFPVDEETEPAGPVELDAITDSATAEDMSAADSEDTTSASPSDAGDIAEMSDTETATKPAGLLSRLWSLLTRKI